MAIALDGSGQVIIAGSTTSTNYHTTAGVFDASANGQNDIFVTKVNAGGTALIYSTYIGGSQQEIANGIAVDNSGNTYLTGYTTSVNFPVTSGAYSTKLQTGGTQNKDAFVVKLNSSGNALVASTYLGGINADEGNGIAVRTDNSVYIAGFAASGFPTTAGALKPTCDPLTDGTDAFVARLSPTFSALYYSTYLGGSTDGTSTNRVFQLSGYCGRQYLHGQGCLCFSTQCQFICPCLQQSVWRN
jgi:hypothetical protein